MFPTYRLCQEKQDSFIKIQGKSRSWLHLFTAVLSTKNGYYGAGSGAKYILMHSENSYGWAGFLGALSAVFFIYNPPSIGSRPPGQISDSTENFQAVSSNYYSPTSVLPPVSSSSAIDYFMEIALGAEWGDLGQRIRRWHKAELTVSVLGTPTEADWRSLQQVSQELEQWTGLQFNLLANASISDIEIHFAPEAEFPRLLPSYRPGNKGFFWVWWNDQGIEHATILIDSQTIDEQARAHLIREELTQSLGLMQDSWRQADSIFYQGWTTTSSYAAIDTSVIAMLYHPQVRSGMTAQEVQRLLEDQFLN